MESPTKKTKTIPDDAVDNEKNDIKIMDFETIILNTELPGEVIYLIWGYALKPLIYGKNYVWSSSFDSNKAS